MDEMLAFLDGPGVDVSQALNSWIIEHMSMSTKVPKDARTTSLRTRRLGSEMPDGRGSSNCQSRAALVA